MTHVTRTVGWSLVLLASLALAQGDSLVGDSVATSAERSEHLTLTADGAVRSAAGANGRWTLEGRTLTLRWPQRVDTFELIAPGRFMSRDRASTLTKDQPPVDLTAVVGLFDAQHPRWRGLVTVLSDGRFWGPTGESGRWTFDGSRLVLAWDREAADVLTMGSAAGRFVRADGRFSMSRVRPGAAPTLPAVAEPPPPAGDPSQVVGLFDVFNDRFGDVVTFAANHTFMQGNGNTGTWAFDGHLLEVAFSRGDRQTFQAEAPGRFVGADRWFLIRRSAAPAPAPPPTMASQPAMPYRPVKVPGEACPQGMGHVTVDEARARRGELCRLLDRWDIARLAGGGSMDGAGYSCGERPGDARQLGHSLCRPAVLVAVPAPTLTPPAPRPFQPFKVEGDGCVGGLAITAEEAAANAAQLCALLGKWDIARVGQGSMDGRGYNCKQRAVDDRKLGHTLCKKE
jgi:hypothetical protein